MARLARRHSGTGINHVILRGDTTLLWRFDGGYVSLNANGTPTCWNYYITDHLGSTRMVVDNNDTIKETISYYPFGSEMKMENPALLNSNSWQRFRFTGKELDRQNGLNMYDFGARWYDVADQIRLVPQNGIGNVKGNRSTVDQLIREENGFYKIIETKLREGTSKLSTGQNRVLEHVENGNQLFEVRSGKNELGLKKGQTIRVDEYEIKYKYKK